MSTTITDRRSEDGIYIVTALATDKQGRTDESIGAVPLGNAKGEARANVIMKAETKAKRRATLALVGLGWLDETEVGSIPDAVLMDGPVGPPQTEPVTNGQPARGPTPQLAGLTDEQEAEFAAELAKKSPDLIDKTGTWRPAPDQFADAMQPPASTAQCRDW